MHEAIHKLSTFTAVVCEVRDDLKATLPGMQLLISYIEGEHQEGRLDRGVCDFAMGLRGCLVSQTKLLNECAQKLQDATDNTSDTATLQQRPNKAIFQLRNLKAVMEQVASILGSACAHYRALIRLIERQYVTNRFAMGQRGALLALCALLSDCAERMQYVTRNDQAVIHTAQGPHHA